jgi:hypothetical protein
MAVIDGRSFPEVIIVDSSATPVALSLPGRVTLGASQDVSFTDTSAQSTAITGTLVRLVAETGACRIAVGTNPTATASSTLLAVGVESYFTITSGHKIAAIRSTATSGKLNITVCS